MHSVPSYSCMFVCVNTALRGVRNTLRRVFSDALMGMCCSLPKHQHPVQTMEGLQSPPPPPPPLYPTQTLNPPVFYL